MNPALQLSEQERVRIRQQELGYDFKGLGIVFPQRVGPGQIVAGELAFVVVVEGLGKGLNSLLMLIQLEIGVPQIIVDLP